MQFHEEQILHLQQYALGSLVDIGGVVTANNSQLIELVEKLQYTFN